ncbi:MAG: hypothetical protein QM813_20750 [Verrucomicrobiota bacterium]
MGGIYIRLPLRRELNFPKICPFSGKPNPTGFVHIRHPAFQWKMPIPFIAGLWKKPVTRVRFPAASSRTLIDQSLKHLTIGLWAVLIVGKFVGRIFLTRDEVATEFGLIHKPPKDTDMVIWFVLGALVITVICSLIRAANVSAVKIIDADHTMAELCFDHHAYAKEFAELNQLRWHDKPFKQRYAREK